MLLHRIFDDFTHALIDQVMVEALPDEVDAAPIVPPDLENDAHLMPLLINLGTVELAQRSVFIEWYETYLAEYGDPPVAAWLKADSDQSLLMAHLARQLVARLYDRNRYLLRYYDPKVFAHLRWILTPTQMQRLFGPIRAWTYSFEGHWETVSNPDQASSAPELLSEVQSQQLSRTAAVNKVMKKTGRAKNHQDFEDQARQVSGYVFRAQAYGWAAERDWVTFATLCAVHHPYFDQHSIIKRVIHEMAHDDTNFTDAAALIDDATWQVVVEELNGKGRTSSGLHKAETLHSSSDADV